MLLLNSARALISSKLVSGRMTGNGSIGFLIKLKQEERLLPRGFPDEYPAYKACVKALIPYVF